MGWIIGLVASGITGDGEGKKVKLPEVGATDSTGDRKKKKVTFRDPLASFKFFIPSW